MNFLSKKVESKSGVALLMTLGVISLLLILGMSFAFSTNTEKMAARNYSYSVKARLTTNSAIERIKAIMNEDFGTSNYPGVAFYTPTAPKSAQAWIDRQGWYMPSINPNDSVKIETGLSFSFRDGRKFTPTYSELATDVNTALIYDSGTHDAGWIHLMNSTDSELVGRYCYLIIDESGKIDPSGATSSSETEITNTQRTGMFETEIMLSNCGLSNTAANSLAHNEPPYEKWSSVGQLLGNLSTANNSDYVYAASSLFPKTRNEPEAYHSGTNDYVRFDLLNVNWNTDVTVTNLQAAKTAFTGAGETTTVIDWLSQIQPVSARNQIAANLIDYCDGDSTATANPTYTYVGLENVPYIYEIAATVIAYDSDTDSFIDSIDVTFQGRLINIYDLDANSNGVLDAGEEFDLSDVQIEIDVTFASMADFTLDASTPSPSTYTVTSGESITNYWAEASNLATFTLNSSLDDQASLAFGITDLKVKLSDSSGNLWDHSTILSSNTNTATLDLIVNDVFFDAQVGDPRNNTLSTDWWTDLSNSSSSQVSLTSRNTNTTISALPTAADDLEDTTAPFPAINTTTGSNTVSTSYIRNGPMQSLWELGCIHRGEPWKTLNLRAYDDGTNGDYDNGDAAILNQVKLSDQNFTRGKINVNSKEERVWNTLLTGVYVGDTYDTISAAGAGNITAGQKNLLIQELASYSTPLVNRAELANISKFSDDTVITIQDNDALQEELIGKIANLLTARTNYYTVLVTAQAVKDLGSGVASIAYQRPDWIQYDKTAGSEKWCEVLAEQKVLMSIYRDIYDGNGFIVDRIEHLEE